MRFKRAFVLGCLLTIAPAAFGNIFLTAQNDPSGGLPVAAVAQDLNNDRVSDIATANQNGRNVSVFLGNRDGTFAPANNFQFGPGAVDIVSGDLDGDGKADLVVADGSTSVNVALGRGDGTFGTASTIKLSDDLEDQAPGIAIADLNADGVLDLAISIYNQIYDDAGRVAVLIGQGDGSSAQPVSYPATENATRLTATDLNNDGVLDPAVAIHFFNTGKGLAVLLGNGDGTFQAIVSDLYRSLTVLFNTSHAQ